MTISDIAAVATAIGVMLAALQLYISSRQAVAAFEDSLNAEYRKLAHQLPTEALLGKSISNGQARVSFDDFYHYFDLCNGQIFLRLNGRVSKKTWKFWADGIRTNLARPAFQNAWIEVAEDSGSDFHELRRAISENFQRDPRSWK